MLRYWLPKWMVCLLVVSAGETTRDACHLAIQRIKQAGGRLLGVVMQKAPVAESSYYYGAYQQQR
jgi:succinoglycan biosynthesis transport protein ExoP